MNWTESPGKSSAELRKYGFTMTAALAVVSALLFFRGHGAWLYTAAAGLAFLVCAFCAPAILAPVERAWMRIAAVLGFVMTNILLTLVFFLAVTPTGFLMKLFGKDPLRRSFDTEADSYWLKTEIDGPGSRPHKPY